MIKASVWPWFADMLAGFAERQLRRNFVQLEVAGLAETRELSRTQPILIVANHTSWWDAMVALVFTLRIVGVRGYALMDVRNLQRFRFFAWVGGFGVDLGSRRDGARAIRYAAARLDEPGTMVWIFPQGRECSPYAPLEFLPGSAAIARLSRGAAVVPVGIRYVFGSDPQATAYVSLGPVIAEHDSRAHAEAVAAELSRIDERLASGVRGPFRPHFVRRATRRSLAAATLDRLAGVALAYGRSRLEPAVPSKPQRAIAPVDPVRPERAHETRE